MKTTTQTIVRGFAMLLLAAQTAVGLAGCSHSFQCHLNGTHCPESSAGSAGSDQSAAAESEPAPGEGEPTSEASAGEAPPQEQAAPCKHRGEEVSHYSECCSEKTTQRGALHNGGTTVCCEDEADCRALAEEER